MGTLTQCIRFLLYMRMEFFMLSLQLVSESGTVEGLSSPVAKMNAKLVVLLVTPSHPSKPGVRV